METASQNKRRIIILATTIGILLIPLIAMNFSDNVNWRIFDFLIAGVLLIVTGLTLDFILRKIKSLRYRILLVIVLLLVLFLIWAELAVGIFGTPFAGS